MTPDVTVVHLAREVYGVQPLAKFATSYKHHPAGHEHDLVFLLKGYKNDPISGVIHSSVLLPDTGFDIDTYINYAHTCKTEYICFFNSWSEILADDWLAKLHYWVTEGGGDMAGATGSWGRIGSTYWLNQPYQDCVKVVKKFMGINQYKRMIPTGKPFIPNPHLRTTAFIIRRNLFIEVTKDYCIKTKNDTYRCENSSDGISQRILNKEGKLFIVGKDGDGYSIDQWNRSGTFFQGEQSNLLVADNKTRLYDNANADEKLALTMSAWGTE
jgi:hypothetical protein